MLAGKRIAQQLNLEVAYVVGDVRHLPFRADSFDVVFSYSVLQHLDKQVVQNALEQMARVNAAGGSIRVQMANVLGIKQLLNHARELVRRLTKAAKGRPYRPYPFRVRAWTPHEILETFSTHVGPAALSADGFFTLNGQASDLDLLRPLERAIVRASVTLCNLARLVPPFANFCTAS